MGGVLTDSSTIDREVWRCHPYRLSPFCSCLGQFEGELTSGLGTAVHQHPAAVGAGDLLHEIEADPHADQVPVGVRFDAGEALEELSLILRLDPEPVIEDADAPVGISLGQA